MDGRIIDIDFSKHYFFSVGGMRSIVPPGPESDEPPGGSFYEYANSYHYLVEHYVREIVALIRAEADVFKKYGSRQEASKHSDYSRAHNLVAQRMIYVQATYTNACLALELYMKALVSEKNRYEDFDIASTNLKGKYGHNLVALMEDTKQDIGFGEDEERIIRVLNTMYSGMKRFQYPHVYVEEVGSLIPPLDDIVILNGKAREAARMKLGYFI